VVVLAVAALPAGSVALAGFGIDSLIEILASSVVIWQLRGLDSPARMRPALRSIAIGFGLLAMYIAVQSAVMLTGASRPGRSVAGAAWLGLTAIVMFALAHGKSRTGDRLGNVVLQTEARITTIDGALAVAILAGVGLNATARWWWADPVCALGLGVYGAREALHAWREASGVTDGGSARSQS
jgi:divalent metal cation (Fe/Co/Zn/Cd) transporter